jgi:hypothetical protein
MLQTNVLVVLLDPGFNEMASLPNVILTTFAGHAVHAWNLESQVVLHRPKEASNLLWWEAHRLYVGQHPADAIVGCADKGKKGDRSGLLRGYGDSLQWIESSLDLLFAMAVLPESVTEELQLIM